MAAVWRREAHQPQVKAVQFNLKRLQFGDPLLGFR